MIDTILVAQRIACMLSLGRYWNAIRVIGGDAQAAAKSDNHE